jgi:transcriptional regulator with XRE-family HTH domain
MLNINKIKIAIESSRMTQDEIAKKGGFSRTTLNNLLNGADVKISTVVNLSEVLGIPASEFFSDDDAPNIRTDYKQSKNDVSILMGILSRFLRNQEQYQEIMKDMMAIYERINEK